MKVLTRHELGRFIQEDSYRIVLLTASVFVLSGSLWAHFALNNTFFIPSFFVLWVLLHLQPFLALFKPHMLNMLSLLGFTTLQVYFYFAFFKLQVPYVPMAPLFFVITALCFPTLQFKQLRWACLFWVACWGSVFYWSSQGPEVHQAQIFLPIMIGALISLSFQLSFFTIQGHFAKKLKKYIKDIGPQNTFDSRRIQASKLQTVGEITASLLHEINNPLTNINGFSHQIREAIDDESDNVIEIVSQSNDRIKFNVDRIKDITSAVRRMVRPQSGTEIEKVDVNALIQDALVLTQHHLKSQGIKVEVNCPSDVAVSVSGNFTELSQVLVNLLTNARDAVKTSEQKTISLGFVVESDEVKIRVDDTGPGIEARIESDVFKPFFTTKASEEGTGLGLYISQMIATRNRGRLAYEMLKDTDSEVLGTRFELILKTLTVEMSDGRVA